MPEPDVRQPLTTVRCDECRSAVRSGGRQDLSFLLLERLTVPVLGCDEHREQFASICGLSSEETPELLDHRPAGGLSCPSCRLAASRSPHPMVQVRDGAIVPMACPDHQSELVQRFRTGLQTEQELTSGLETHTGASL